MSEIKEHFREFMRGVLPTGMYTVFFRDVGHEQRRHCYPNKRSDQGKTRERARLVPHAVEVRFRHHALPVWLYFQQELRKGVRFALVVVSAGTSDQTHEAFSVRPTPFGDCSGSTDTVNGHLYRLHQVHRTTAGGMQILIWQTSRVY